MRAQEKHGSDRVWGCGSVCGGGQERPEVREVEGRAHDSELGWN